MARPGTDRGRGTLHVGRYLATLFALIALLYTTVFLGGPGSDFLAPKLGLDLQGGASVILEPKTERGGRPPSTEQLETAKDIIERRVNGLGVAEAEVVTQGDNIVVSVPGGTRDSLRSLVTTAQLRFREVLDVQPASPQAQASLAPSGAPSGAPSAAVTLPPRTATAAPSASATTRGRALPEGLAAGPAPSASASASPTPTPSRTAATGGDDEDGTGPQSGDRFTPEAFAALTCEESGIAGGGATDAPQDEIIACSQDGSLKYRLAPAKVIGTDVKGATAGLDQFGSEWQILVDFTGEGQRKFTQLTVETTGKQVAIVLDAVVLSAPTIQERIDSDAQITGDFTQREATELANTLKYGALPLSFEPSEEQEISPTLGKDQLSSGLLAGGIGLIVVVIYSLLYYRLLGIVTVLSLIVSGVMTYALVSILGQQIGFALSLAGIAGFIVAVGITADSFVVFFERLKEEIKNGRSPRAAVDTAWVRARRTILSANTVSFLAAIILYFLSVGSVRGFAFTLGLSTLLDVVVVFLFTRPVVSWLSRFAWFSNRHLTGFVAPEIGGEITAGRRPARPATAATATATEA